MNLHEQAKIIINEEKAANVAKDMKAKGYNYVIAPEDDNENPVYAKDPKDVADMLSKEYKDKKASVVKVEAYIKTCEKKVEEAKDRWMESAVKHSGKLRADLGLKKGEKIYQVGVEKIVAYAKKDKANADRVRLARTMARRRGSSQSKQEKDFWDSVATKLGWDGKKESRKIQEDADVIASGKVKIGNTVYNYKELEVLPNTKKYINRELGIEGPNGAWYFLTQRKDGSWFQMGLKASSKSRELSTDQIQFLNIQESKRISEAISNAYS